MSQQIPIRGEGITADLLLFRIHGIAGQALVEEMLEMNPGLADLGEFIPLGTVVTVPDLPSPDAFVARPVVTLFG